MIFFFVAFVQEKYTTVTRECILDTINQKCADARKKPKFKPKVNIIQFQAPRLRNHISKLHVAEHGPITHTSTVNTSCVTTSSIAMPFENCGDNVSFGSNSTCVENARSSSYQAFKRTGSVSVSNKNVHFGTIGQNPFHITMHNCNNCTVNFNITKCDDKSPQGTDVMAKADTFTEESPVLLSTNVPSRSYQSNDPLNQLTNAGEQRKTEQSVKRKQDMSQGENDDYVKKQKLWPSQSNSLHK